MRIALINENSQAAKNAVIYSALKKVADEKGFDVRNYGMYSPDDSAQLTYVQNGILAAVLLNSGAADFVVTGCGTGEGAMLALNSFPGVICGHIETPLDAYTFAQINAGNAVSIPYALGFGWGGDLNLQYIFEKLWSEPFGSGYPKERAVPEQRNKKILDGVKEAAFRPLPDILKDLAKKDPELVKGAFAGAHFDEYFEEDCRKPEYLDLVKKLR
jgi:ribose 5-phosphate isomerase RpiB